MQQKWSHRENVAGRSRTLNVSSEWSIENLRGRKNAADVTGGYNAESAGVSVGSVEVEAKGNDCSTVAIGPDCLCLRAHERRDTVR